MQKENVELLAQQRSHTRSEKFAPGFVTEHAPAAIADISLGQSLRTALPMFLSLSMISAISLIDITLAGILGPTAQAALGIADQIVFLNMLVMTGFCAGVNSFVSQSFGAGRLSQARTQMKYSMILSSIVGIVATAVGFCAADPVASAFTSNPAVQEQAAMFIRLCAFGNLPWALVMCQGAIFRASGNARLCVAQWLIITLLCVGGELVAFFILPGCRSIAPLAVSWDLAVFAGFLVGNRSLKKLTPESIPFSLSDFAAHARSLLAVGAPVMVAEMCWLFSNLLLFSLLSVLPQPTTNQAAWTLHLKIEEAVAYVPLMAWCQATATITGNRIGAANHQEARRISARMAVAAVLVMFILGCVTALTAPLAVQLASSDAEVKRISQQLLLGSIVTFPMNALTLVLSAALEGAGSTVMPMTVNLVGLIVVRLPMAWLLAVPGCLGIAGVWMAKCLSNALTVCGMLVAFKRANWRKTQTADSASVIHSTPEDELSPVWIYIHGAD